MGNNQHFTEDMEKPLAFAEQEKMMQVIISDRQYGLQKYLDTLSAEVFAQLFGTTQQRLEICTACVDEGIQLSGQQQNRLRIAGSGILLGQQRAVQLWQQAGITTVTAHEGCGAAKLYCEQQKVQTDNSSQYVADILKEWAEKAGKQFTYIPTLNRPNFHDARIVSIVSMPDFRPHDVNVLPKTFVVSAMATPAEVAADAILSAQIALGEHGLHSLFTPDSPLLMALIGASADRMKMDEISSLMSHDAWLSQNTDRIIIQSAIISPTGTSVPAAS